MSEVKVKVEWKSSLSPRSYLVDDGIGQTGLWMSLFAVVERNSEYSTAQHRACVGRRCAVPLPTRASNHLGLLFAANAKQCWS